MLEKWRFRGISYELAEVRAGRRRFRAVSISMRPKILADRVIVIQRHRYPASSLSRVIVIPRHRGYDPCLATRVFLRTVLIVEIEPFLWQPICFGCNYVRTSTLIAPSNLVRRFSLSLMNKTLSSTIALGSLLGCKINRPDRSSTYSNTSLISLSTRRFGAA